MILCLNYIYVIYWLLDVRLKLSSMHFVVGFHIYHTCVLIFLLYVVFDNQESSIFEIIIVNVMCNYVKVLHVIILKEGRFKHCISWLSFTPRLINNKQYFFIYYIFIFCENIISSVVATMYLHIPRLKLDAINVSKASAKLFFNYIRYVNAIIYLLQIYS